MDHAHQSSQFAEGFDVPKVYEALGGKENILELTHCISRVRFIIKNMAKIDRMELAKLKLNVVYAQDDQVHLVLGNSTKKFFEIFEELSK
ncbi:MAG: PTS transporter subunit EIIB [Brevinema sp.]